MSRVRLVVFDLDGTLVDSRRDLAESANALLAECGCGPLAEDSIGRMVGAGAATLVARAFIASACAQPPDALVRFLAIYNARLLSFTRPYPGIREVLSALEHRLNLALLTNKPLEATRQILMGLDLARFFQASRVVAGDGVLPRKPNPSGLRHLAAGVGASGAETMLVGDSLIDWRTARAAEAHICLARYGFGFEGFPMNELSPHDHVIDAPADLLRIL